MIFSKSKWSDSEELNQFIPVSAALSFEKVESSLEDAWRLFVLPLLGQELAKEVDSYYTSESPSDLQIEILQECQRAVANLAFWYNFTELNIRITDQGMQRQESEGSFKQTYKYQEDLLRHSFKNKGFNALDRLIELFDKNQADFSAYEQSPAYASRKNAIVRNTAEVDAIYFINKSHLIFLRLVPIFKMMEETSLQSALGQNLFKALKQNLKENIPNIGDTTTEELRLQCVPFIVFKALAELVRTTGSITDRGLYYLQLHEGDGNMSMSPSDHDTAVLLANHLEKNAANYQSVLTNFIEANLPDLFGGRKSDVFDRDNDHKCTVWL